MSRMPASQARRDFGELLNRVAYGRERIALARRGKDLVAVVPADDVALLQEIEDRIDIEAAKKALKEKGRIPWAKVKAQLGL